MHRSAATSLGGKEVYPMYNMIYTDTDYKLLKTGTSKAMAYYKSLIFNAKGNSVRPLAA